MRPKKEDEELIIKSMEYFKAHVLSTMNIAFSYGKSEYEAVVALDPLQLVKDMK